MDIDRYWFLTWTTYGSWLPGDPRGFVGKRRDARGRKTIRNTAGTPFDADEPALRAAATNRLACRPIKLLSKQAEAVFDQLRETAEHRRWQLLAVGVMHNHVHVVVGVPGDPDPESVLRDLKSYASRALNEGWTRPASGTWWTRSGSKRKLADEDDIVAAVVYVKEQYRPLCLWVREPLLG